MSIRAGEMARWPEGRLRLDRLRQPPDVRPSRRPCVCARSLWGFALKALALEAIAKEQTLSGRLDLAFESYVLIEPTEKERSQALLAIVEAQAKAGQWAEARQSATKIRVDESLARALATLAAAQAKGGHR